MSESRGTIGRFLHSAIAGFEQDIESLGQLLSDEAPPDRKVRLLAYAGYRNAAEARLMGRVVRYARPLDTGEGKLSRLRAMMAIYNSAELPGVLVRCEGYGHAMETVSDEEGYFTFHLPVDVPLPAATAWEAVTISTPGREAQQPTIPVSVIAPGTDNHWGIISDIDDTVIETGATNFLKNWRRVLIDRPQDRLAVPGASRLYTMIGGSHPAPVRPFFYVSSSPWNLYGFIAEFMELNGIPHGPMFLKDYGIDDEKLIKDSHEAHKLQAIETILSFYPGFRFMLIGDNGQQDVEIYARAVDDYSDRIGAVFIRDVSAACEARPKSDVLAGIKAKGIPTFCGAGFEDALSVARLLQLDRPAEAARAAIDSTS